MKDTQTTEPELSFADLLEGFIEETQDIVDEILEDGASPDAVYMIEHHLSCMDADILKKAAVACFKKGYEVTDHDQLESEDGAMIFNFDVIVEMNLDETAIIEDVEKLLKIAQSFNVNYDGWGTYPEK
jgi:regulator of RNase E activity RraB